MMEDKERWNIHYAKKPMRKNVESVIEIYIRDIELIKEFGYQEYKQRLS